MALDEQTTQGQETALDLESLHVAVSQSDWASRGELRQIIAKVPALIAEILRCHAELAEYQADLFHLRAATVTETDDRLAVEWPEGKPSAIRMTSDLFEQMVEMVNAGRADRDSWARRFASVEKELNEKAGDVLRAVGRWHDDPLWSGTELAAEVARIFAGPSSVADYELLGTPVEDKQ